MVKNSKKPVVSLGFLAFLLILPQIGFVAPIPNSTLELLERFKLDRSVLDGIDQELKLPEDWILQAKKEGKLKVRGSPATPKELKNLLGSFKDRYPFIKVDYFGANRQGRTIKTLMAYRSGRLLADMVMSVGTFANEFNKIRGVENLLGLPTLKNVPEGMKDENGNWVGVNRNYWCMSYNTALVDKQDLPKKWEDILTNQKWRGGNLALGNRPNLWAVNLWLANGEDWTKKFLTRLFTEVKPQLRKEGMNALPQLLAAGEFHAAIPSNYKRPYQIALAGGPVSFTCPEPVPASPGDQTIILKGAPNVHAAKIFLNWLMSKEGQIAQYAHEYAAPLDDILGPKLLPYADQILGKKASFRNPNLDKDVMPKLFEFWNALWLKGGGTPRR